MAAPPKKKKERFVTFNEHCERHIFPYLIPAIVAYVKSVNGAAKIDEAQPFDKRSMPLIAHIFNRAGSAIHDGLLHVYATRKKRPPTMTAADALADYLFEHAPSNAKNNANGTSSAALLIAEHLMRFSTRPRPATTPGKKTKTVLPPLESRSFDSICKASSLEATMKQRKQAAKMDQLLVVPEPTPAYLGEDAIADDINRSGKRIVLRSSLLLGGRLRYVSITREQHPLGLHFVLFDPACGRQADRFVPELEVHALMPVEMRWRVSLQFAAMQLFKRLFLVRKLRRISIGFTPVKDPADGKTELKVLRQSGLQIGDDHCTVEVLKRSSSGSKQEDLLFRIYNPRNCSMSTTVCCGTDDFSLASPTTIDCLMKMLRLNPDTQRAELLLFRHTKLISGQECYVSLCVEGSGLRLVVNRRSSSSTGRLEVAWAEARKYGFDPLVAFTAWNQAGTGSGLIIGEPEKALFALSQSIEIVEPGASAKKKKAKGGKRRGGPPPRGAPSSSSFELRLKPAPGSSEPDSTAAATTKGSRPRKKSGKMRMKVKMMGLKSMSTVNSVKKRRDEVWKMRADAKFRQKRMRKQPEAMVWAGGLRLEGDFGTAGERRKGRMYFVAIFMGPAIVNGFFRFEVYSLTTGHVAELTVHNRDNRQFKTKDSATLRSMAVKMASRLRVSKNPTSGDLGLELMEAGPFETKLRRSFNLMGRNQRGRIKVSQLRHSLSQLQYRIPNFLRAVGVSKHKQGKCWDFVQSQLTELDGVTKPELDWDGFKRVLST